MSNPTNPHQIIDITRQIYPHITDTAELLIEATKVAGIVNILIEQGWKWDSQKGRAIPILADIEEVPEKILNPAYRSRKRTRKRRKLKAAEVVQRVPEPGSVGERLRAYVHGKRIVDVARHLGVNTASVYGWMSGKWQPSGDYRVKLEELLK